MAPMEQVLSMAEVILHIQGCCTRLMEIKVAIGAMVDGTMASLAAEITYIRMVGWVGSHI